MASAAFSLVWLVFLIAVLAGLWVGVLGLRQGGRNGAWWTMMIAISGITLGALGLACMGSIMLGSGPSSGPSPMVLVGIASLLIPFSSLLFVIGFAIHGLKTARVRERMQELEQLTEAMSQEINRLREGGQA